MHYRYAYVSILPHSLALLRQLCLCTRNYTEKKFELKATAVTTLTHNVLRPEKQSHSSQNKQAAQSLHNLSSHALFSGTKVCSSTAGPQGWPWLTVFHLCSNFNVFSVSSLSGSQGRYRTESEETADQGYKKYYIYIDLFLHPGDSSHRETRAKRLNDRTAVCILKGDVERQRDVTMNSRVQDGGQGQRQWQLFQFFIHNQRLFFCNTRAGQWINMYPAKCTERRD